MKEGIIGEKRGVRENDIEGKKGRERGEKQNERKKDGKQERRKTK